MPLFTCRICQNSRRPWKALCKDCGHLFEIVARERGTMGFSELLDTLLATGIDKRAVHHFLTANPTGKGSIMDQITAQLTNNLAAAMGVKKGEMSAEDVKKIRENPTGFASEKALNE